MPDNEFPSRLLGERGQESPSGVRRRPLSRPLSGTQESTEIFPSSSLFRKSEQTEPFFSNFLALSSVQSPPCSTINGEGVLQNLNSGDGAAMSDPVALGVLAVVSILAGAIASVSGFGIGSLLTPVLAVRVGTKLAVAAVSIPHVAATALRFWLMREHVDRKLLWSFGLMSAAGGLLGALLHNYAGSPALTIVFGSLLIFTGLMGLTGLSERMRFRGWVGWLAGGVSGLLGGLVGNQGGIRAGAMLGFDVPRHAFVATATAVGLIVDGARLPVYLASQGEEMIGLWPFLLTATVGTLFGTLIGERLLRRLPEGLYRRLVAGLVLVLGVFMIWQGSA